MDYQGLSGNTMEQVRVINRIPQNTREQVGITPHNTQANTHASEPHVLVANGRRDAEALTMGRQTAMQQVGQ